MPHLVDRSAKSPPDPIAAQAPRRLRIVIIGLTITSSWGNGHATTYRGLVRELACRGHDVLFLEHDKPWYAQNRDLPDPPYGRTALYDSVATLKSRFTAQVETADMVIVGSYVPDGIAVGQWVVATTGGIAAFYDIDTPVTLARLAAGNCEYLCRSLLPLYDLYLSFTGGPTLRRLENEYGAHRAAPLYCSVDPELYFPQPQRPQWDLGYLGTYSDDRQPALSELLIKPAKQWTQGRFVVAGPKYPDDIDFAGIERIEHLPPPEHRRFYNRQRFTLNITRADMIAAGYSPSVRLFEAAACGVPIISDWWDGLDCFFEPGVDILIARSAGDVVDYIRCMPDEARHAIAANAREKVLACHTAARRAAELEHYALSWT